MLVRVVADTKAQHNDLYRLCLEMKMDAGKQCLDICCSEWAPDYSLEMVALAGAQVESDLYGAQSSVGQKKKQNPSHHLAGRCPLLLTSIRCSHQTVPIINRIPVIHKWFQARDQLANTMQLTNQTKTAQVPVGIHRHTLTSRKSKDCVPTYLIPLPRSDKSDWSDPIANKLILALLTTCTFPDEVRIWYLRYLGRYRPGNRPKASASRNPPAPGRNGPGS